MFWDLAEANGGISTCRHTNPRCMLSMLGNAVVAVLLNPLETSYSLVWTLISPTRMYVTPDTVLGDTLTVLVHRVSPR